MPSLELGIQPHNARPEYRIDLDDGGTLGGQRLIIALSLQYLRTTVAVGRRAGKTTALLFLIPEEQQRIKGRYYAGIMCQDHGKAQELQEVFIEAYGGDPRTSPNSFVTKVKRSANQTRYIETRALGEQNTGSRIYFWSGVHPHYNKIRGFTHPFHRIIIDEASYIHPDAIIKVASPMLIDAGGRMLAIGTPDFTAVGFEWFKENYERGKSRDPKWSGFASMNAPSESNPTLPLETIKVFRAECETPEAEKQEIDALFLEDTSSVFGDLQMYFELPVVSDPRFLLLYAAQTEVSARFASWCGVGEQDPEAGVHYLVTADWGKSQDKTVMSVCRLDNGHEVARVAMWGEEYDVQLAYVVALRRHYNNASIIVDSQSVGDAMAASLKKTLGEEVTQIKFTPANKESYVRQYKLVLRTRQYRLLNIPDVRTEHRQFVFEKTPAGRIIYHAAINCYDDHVDVGMMTAPKLLESIPINRVDPDGAGIRPVADYEAEEDPYIDDDGNRVQPGSFAALKLSARFYDSAWNDMLDEPSW